MATVIGLTRRVHRRSVPPCERGVQRAAVFALPLLPRVTLAVGFQYSLTLFFFFSFFFFFLSCWGIFFSIFFSFHPSNPILGYRVQRNFSRKFVAWRGRPITSSCGDSTAPVANQFGLRREESPHGRFCAFFPLAIPIEPFMSHCQMLRMPHHLHILSAWKIILVSLSGKRAFPLRNHTSNDADYVRNFSIIAHIGAQCPSLACWALF